MTSRWKLLSFGLFTIVLATWPTAAPAARAEEKKKPDLGEIPKQVMETLKTKFPKAEIRKWTKEMEGNDVVYDIEFQQEGRNFEADIKENGTIHNWEKAIDAKALPPAVTKVVEKKYPKATFKEVMEITEIKDGKDSLEGYEIVLDSADKQEVEVTVAPDGKILEDSGETKEPKATAKSSTNEIPKKVMAALKAKFPKAEIDMWTKENEGNIVVYDIEFQQDGRKFEADIKEDGSIHNWEKAITKKSLPKEVKQAVKKKYRKATVKEVMEITEVKDGKDVLEGYEIVLETRDNKDVEVTVAPDGKILEDSGAAK